MNNTIPHIAVVRSFLCTTRVTSAFQYRFALTLLLIGSLSSGCDYLKIKEESTAPTTSVAPPPVETKAPEPPPKPPEPKPDPPEKVAERIIEQFYKLNLGQITDASVQSLASIYEPARETIEKLELKRSQITDNVFTPLKAFPNLKDLNLAETKLTRESLENLPTFQKVERLILRKLPVDNALVSRLTDVKSIRSLDLSYTAIDDDALLHVDQFPNLEILRVSGNPSITGGGFRGARSLSKLRILDIHSTALVDPALPIIARFPLEHLDLSLSPGLTDQGIVKLAGIRTLKVLILRDCQNLSSLGISKLARLPNLYAINLANIPKFDDRGLKFFQSTKSLRYMIVSQTSVSERGKTALMKANPKLLFEVPKESTDTDYDN